MREKCIGRTQLLGLVCSPSSSNHHSEFTEEPQEGLGCC